MSKKSDQYIKINTTLPTDLVEIVAKTIEKNKKRKFEERSRTLSDATAPRKSGETNELARKRRRNAQEKNKIIAKKEKTWNPKPSLNGNSEDTDFLDMLTIQKVLNSGEIRDLDKIEAAKRMSDFNNYSMFGVNYANGQNPYINNTDDYNKAASSFEVTKGNMRNFIQAPALAYVGFTLGPRTLLTSIAGAATGKEGGEYIAKKTALGLSNVFNLNLENSNKLDALAEFAGGLGGTILGGSAGFAAGKTTSSSRNPNIIFNKNFTGKSDIINPKGFENYFIPWYLRFVNNRFPNIAKITKLDYDLKSAISDYARGKTVSVGRLNLKSTTLTEVLNRIENENSLNSVNQTKQGLASMVSDNSPGWSKESVMDLLDWGINRTRVVEPYNNATAKANDQFIDILTRDSLINPSYNTAGLYGNSTIRYRSNATGNTIGHEAVHAAEDNVPEAESILAYKLFPEWPYASERGTSIHDIIFNNKEYPDIRSIGGMDYVLSLGNGYTQLFSNTVRKLPIERLKVIRKELEDILKYFYPQ